MRVYTRREDWETLKPTVHGWGINDVNEPVSYYVAQEGVAVRKKCPYYEDWRRILRYCFNNKWHKKSPTYKGCTVCNEWKYFSNFVKWVDSQPNKDWVNCSLDKDILVSGNKVYSPETCAYVSAKVNSFVLDGYSRRGKYMIGVRLRPEYISTPYEARCCDPFTARDKNRLIGFFTTEIEAHKAWQTRKHKFSCQLAELQPDPRVKKALMERYSPDKDWTKA